MADSESYRDYILEILGDVRPIRSRKMFGGLGIWDLDTDLFFALIAEDTLYFKVDESTSAGFIERGMAKFMNMGFYAVPDDILEDPEELVIWIDRAVAVAGQKKRKSRGA